MDIQAEKLELIEMLLHTENEGILDKIKTIFKTENIESQSMISEEQWAIVAERRAKYLRGEGYYHTLEEAKQIVLNNCSSKK